MTAETEINGQAWLICGGRDFADSRYFLEAMRRIVRERGLPEIVLHGGQRGADTMADNWANDMEADCLRVAAKWTQQGKQAGPIRNTRMLGRWTRPHLVIAFPGGKGTANMVTQAAVAGVEILRINALAPQKSTVTEPSD